MLVDLEHLFLLTCVLLTVNTNATRVNLRRINPPMWLRRERRSEAATGYLDRANIGVEIHIHGREATLGSG